MNERGINTVWDEICAAAGVEGKTPHSARHAMGRHIMKNRECGGYSETIGAQKRDVFASVRPDHGKGTQFCAK